MILIGAGGHAKVICSIIEALGQKVDIIFDDNEAVLKLNEYDVSGPYQSSFFLDMKVIIAIGNNKIRKLMTGRIKHSFGKLIHPSAIIDKNVQLGDGTVIFHGAIIQRDSIIGSHGIINTRSAIDHDCKIGDYVHISPGALLCGCVSIGDGTQIGAGSTVIPGITIGKWCVIGAGAVIINDIPDYSIVVGVPGRIIKKNQ